VVCHSCIGMQSSSDSFESSLELGMSELSLEKELNSLSKRQLQQKNRSKIQAIICCRHVAGRKIKALSDLTSAATATKAQAHLGVLSSVTTHALEASLNDQLLPNFPSRLSSSRPN
jgi:hypothetical protein